MSTDMGQGFGEHLRQLRKEKSKSMGDIARHIGVSVPYVSDVELGRRKPFAKVKIAQVAELLGVPAEPLIALAASDRGVVELDLEPSTDSCAAGDSLKCSTEARKLRDEVEQLRVDLERAKQLNVRLAKLLMESYGVEL